MSAIDRYRYNMQVDGNSFFSEVHIWSTFHELFKENVGLTLGNIIDIFPQEKTTKMINILKTLKPYKQERVCQGYALSNGENWERKGSSTVISTYESGIIVHAYNGSIKTFDINNLYDLYLDNPEDYMKNGSINIYARHPEKITDKNLSNFIIEEVLSMNSLNGKPDDKQHLIGILMEDQQTRKLFARVQNISDLGESNDYAFEDLYNDDFFPVNDNIIKNLEEKETGITLLHGEPGTGKTSYLRWLIRNCKDMFFVYLPPYMTSRLGTPDFLSFLTQNAAKRGKVVYIVEDAENVLRTREAGGNEAVANLLNASSGLLGDVIKAHFICTFNCEEDQIDSALLRPGRLVDRYEFTKLDTHKTENLWKKVHGNRELPKSRMTIAEIFNHESITNPLEENNEQPFGFMPAANEASGT